MKALLWLKPVIFEWIFLVLPVENIICGKYATGDVLNEYVLMFFEMFFKGWACICLCMIDVTKQPRHAFECAHIQPQSFNCVH